MQSTHNPDFLSRSVAAEIEGWLDYLGSERRMAAKTVEAYRRDVLQFLGFLAEHLGGAPSLTQLAALKPADVRAFMAARRAQGIGSRSLMRTLAGTRAFARYLERSGKGQVGALSAVRARPRSRAGSTISAANGAWRRKPSRRIGATCCNFWGFWPSIWGGGPRCRSLGALV